MFIFTQPGSDSNSEKVTMDVNENQSLNRLGILCVVSCNPTGIGVGFGAYTGLCEKAVSSIRLETFFLISNKSSQENSE